MVSMVCSDALFNSKLYDRNIDLFYPPFSHWTYFSIFDQKLSRNIEVNRAAIESEGTRWNSFLKPSLITSWQALLKVKFLNPFFKWIVSAFPRTPVFSLSDIVQASEVFSKESESAQENVKWFVQIWPSIDIQFGLNWKMTTRILIMLRQIRKWAGNLSGATDIDRWEWGTNNWRKMNSSYLFAIRNERRKQKQNEWKNIRWIIYYSKYNS